MKACPNCGQPNPEEDRFCVNCGADMDDEVLIKGDFSGINFVTVLYCIIGAIFFLIGFPALFRGGAVGFLLLLLSIVFFVLAYLFYYLLKRLGITVTKNRIRGRYSIRNEIDLPIDKIAAVAKFGRKGLIVSTSAGRIRFRNCRNRDDVFTVISNLINKRQASLTYTSENVSGGSTAQEIKQYKELLDQGIITQEEFDAKKKQLLGL